MSEKNPKIDEFFNMSEKWQDEMKALRTIVLNCNLKEELKWGKPCYLYDNNNVVIIGAFKDYCALMFMKGVLLKDPQGILVKAGENSNYGRQIRFTSVDMIKKMTLTIKDYINAAIEVEKMGLKVQVDRSNDLECPEECKQIMREQPGFEKAFKALTPGRQRAYILYFSQAKQSETRTARVEKYIDRILDGKGINDCVCGLSKTMPRCDGSHKQLEK